MTTLETQTHSPKQEIALLLRLQHYESQAMRLYYEFNKFHVCNNSAFTVITLKYAICDIQTTICPTWLKC